MLDKGNCSEWYVYCALDVDVLPMRRYMRVFVLFFLALFFLALLFYVCIIDSLYAVHLLFLFFFFFSPFLWFIVITYFKSNIYKEIHFFFRHFLFLLLLLLLPSFSRKLLLPTFYFSNVLTTLMYYILNRSRVSFRSNVMWFRPSQFHITLMFFIRTNYQHLKP